uniref:Vankyrin 1 n=1 Tax=Campoletis sonorensis ichnovirus TaxID=10484 RepID=Q56IA8_CSIV|nr:vankyrin 1 [Ichnoviriform sonorense]
MEISQIRKLFGKNRVTKNTIFHELAHAGSLTLLYRVRDNIDEPCSSILQEVNADGDYSIHVAAKTHRGQLAVRIIQVLLELGANLNAKDRVWNFTVLHVAVERDDYVLAKWLRHHPQIDLDARGWDGLTAHETSLITCNKEMMDIFRTDGVNRAGGTEPKVNESTSNDNQH